MNWCRILKYRYVQYGTLTFGVDKGDGQVRTWCMSPVMRRAMHDNEEKRSIWNLDRHLVSISLCKYSDSLSRSSSLVSTGRYWCFCKTRAAMMVVFELCELEIK